MNWKRYVTTMVAGGDHKGELVIADLWQARRGADDAVLLPVVASHHDGGLPPHLPIGDLALSPERTDSIRFSC